MTLEQAIKHAEEVAEENQERANSNILIERNGTKFLYDGEEYKKCYKCAIEHRQLAEWLKDYKRLLEQEPKTEQFAQWVAEEVIDEELWELNYGAFAELACRKLEKLGIVRAKGDEWELVEPQESKNEE